MSAGEAPASRAPRFFVEDGVPPANSELELAAPAAHHATRVLRLATGAALTLFDGRGGEHGATIVAADRRGVRVRIDRFVAVEREASQAVTLAMAVIATDAMDAALRKAVEVGVARIEPVMAARSQGGIGGERAARRAAHWRHIAIAACEQCGRNRVPAVADAEPLTAWLARAGEADVMLAPDAGEALAAFVKRAPPRAIVVGPEGGFTGAEIDLARRRGLRLASLGPSILRADTAAVAALAIALAARG
jgi:16S rRNA (uracil1498-N3)-methyltransferase